MSISKRGKNHEIDYYCKGKRDSEMISPSKKEASAVLRGREILNLLWSDVDVKTHTLDLGDRRTRNPERYANLTPDHMRNAIEYLPDRVLGDKDSRKTVNK